MRSSSGSSGDRAGAAGTGFTDPSFVDADGDVPIAKVAYELKIDALRKLLSWIPAGSRMKRQPIKVVYKAHGMGVAYVRRQRLELSSVTGGNNDPVISNSHWAQRDPNSAVR